MLNFGDCDESDIVLTSLVVSRRGTNVQNLRDECCTLCAPSLAELGFGFYVVW